jgi:hypothetical protein
MAEASPANLYLRAAFPRVGNQSSAMTYTIFKLYSISRDRQARGKNGTRFAKMLWGSAVCRYPKLSKSVTSQVNKDLLEWFRQNNCEVGTVVIFKFQFGLDSNNNKQRQLNNSPSRAESRECKVVGLENKKASKHERIGPRARMYIIDRSTLSSISSSTLRSTCLLALAIH